MASLERSLSMVFDAMSGAGASPQDALQPSSSDDKNSTKCGALCMYLPGMSKRKPLSPLPAQVPSPANSATSASGRGESLARASSRAASLERFECSSCSSFIIFDFLDGEGDVGGGGGHGSRSPCFELPEERVRGCGSFDTDSPVASAFVFDGREGKDAASRLATGKSLKLLASQLSRSSSSRPSSPAQPPASCVAQSA